MRRDSGHYVDRSRGRPQHGPRPCRGMTLIELMVSLGVLSVICIAFATIMAQTHRVVNSSNALMQANATAAAIAQTLRDDLTSLSTQGFVAVRRTSGGPRDKFNLMFFSVGPFSSLIDPKIKANAARIDYGWTDNNTPNDPNDDLLWRRAVLLTGTTAGPVDWDPNKDYDDSAWLGRYDPSCPSPISWYDALTKYFIDPSVPLNPKTRAEVQATWPMLARPVDSFRVSVWSAGQWLEPTEGGPTPIAPPPAIRVNFSIKTGPKEQDKLDYEVICPLRL